MPPKPPKPPTEPSDKSPVRGTRVGSGKAVVAPMGDPHSWFSRRYGEVLTRFLDDIGGADLASEVQMVIAKRAAGHTVRLEVMEAEMSAGQEVDDKLYYELSGNLSRLIGRLMSPALNRRKPRQAEDPLVAHFSRPVERT